MSAGIWITVALVLVGAMVPGLAVAVATALGWALGHYWPHLKRQGARETSPDGAGGPSGNWVRRRRPLAP